MKNFKELVDDVLKNTEMTTSDKAAALIKLGLTKFEAEVLSKRHAPLSVFGYTFGVEIECINCQPDAFIQNATRNGLRVMNHMHQYSGCHTDRPIYKLVPDGSLSGAYAAECVTPALNGDNSGFASLEACCKSLSAIGATVNSTCGLHVHIGAASMKDEHYCNVFVNYMYLETAINSILAPSRRDGNSRWCKSLLNRKNAVLCARTKGQMRTALCTDRYHRVNAEAYSRHQTIEFRQHQGTTNYTKISNWVKFLAKLVEWSAKNRLAEPINRIEDIPFLNEEEKAYFTARRAELARA